ncbi:Hpt domain-containing protein [Actinoplanes sp. NPDC051494]|uniref:Hpt domain-containing protein n=1 Tax=Actinoplanes sp. NPDC051494 TaxID=3363907 RepID=UPI00378DE584
MVGVRDGIQARLDEICDPEPSEPERRLLVRLLTSYVTKTPPAIDRLAEALASGAADEVRDQAHALKGSATNLGVTVLSELFGALEDSARAGVLPDPEPTLARIRETYRDVEPVCTALAGELDVTGTD